MAAPVNKAKFMQDINAPIKAVYGGGLMFSKDNLSNVISVDIVDNGQPFEVTGTVAGTVIRSDGSTVPVTTGAISDNTVSLTLTEACFDVPGQIVVNIIVTNGDVKCCVLRAVYTVVPTETSAVIDPGDILPSIADLIDDIDAAVDSINAAIASIPADYSGLLASIAGTFSPSKPYVAGEYIWYDGTLYRFTAAHAAGDWTGSDVTVVTIGGELTALNRALEDQRQTYNWLPQRNYYSQVQKGNPCTINERTYSIRTNGEILVTGATSATGSTYYISRSIQVDGWDGFILPAGRYRFYTKEDISAYANIGVRFPGDSSWQFYFSKNGNIQTIEADTAVTIGIEIKSSRVLPENGILVQPMIVRVDEDYGYIAPWASLANYVPQILEENSEQVAQIASIENQVAKKADVLSSDETESDLDITDRNGNVLVRFASGHIQTKEFDSKNVLQSIDALSQKMWTGKKWAAVGDSLTEVNQRTTKHYHDYIADDTGISVVNLGHSGAGYYARPSDYTFRRRVNDVPLDSDVVTIFGSGNDIGKEPLGDVTDTAATTLCGCINITLDNLYARMPVVQLGIITPTPWINYTPMTPGNAMELYCEAIVEICRRRSIPCLDLYHCSNLRPDDATFRQLAYSKDDGGGVHPDETGHFLIASRFKAFLGTLLL